MTCQTESLFFAVGAKQDRLHVKRFFDGDGGPVVLLLHGSVENSRIFYSRSLKGLAPYLARQGFDVYALDFRGRGESRPSIGPDSEHGQWELINEDLPTIMAELSIRHQEQPLHLMAHSWGGVIAHSFLARYPGYLPQVRSLTYWGTKRSVAQRNGEAWLKIRVIWEKLAFVLTAAYGYLPAQRWGLGADNETRRSHAEGAAWTRASSAWRDPRDGFDYAAAAQALDWPPGLYLAGQNDLALAHVDDVARFRRESQPQRGLLHVLGTGQGQARDYGHIDMLTHPQAPQDHFPLVVEFLQQGTWPQSDEL
jgi:pimeloyl-ACP methyl ester carboxylesterase